MDIIDEIAAEKKKAHTKTARDFAVKKSRAELKILQLELWLEQESRREGWTDACSAVGFCLGSGLFGSYNSD